LSLRFQVLSSFSIDALKANKMRSFLTMLGIIIGVAVVMLMVSIGQGTKQQVLSRINSLGSNLLTVMPGKLTGVACVAPTVRGSALATCGNKTWTTSISGTTQEITDISSLEIEQGRFFGDSDVDSFSAVVVIGQTVYENLFDSGADPVGSEIRLAGVTFNVVGLLKTLGASSGGNDRDDTRNKDFFIFCRLVYVNFHSGDCTFRSLCSCCRSVFRLLPGAQGFQVEPCRSAEL